MGGIITYYFAPISGYAYLGHRSLIEMAKAHRAVIDYRPLVIARVFAASETTPPFAQSAPRQSYRIEDQARWAAQKGLAMTPTPAYWPTDPMLACQCIVAAGNLGFDPDALTFACLRAVWAEERNIADAETLVDILKAEGYDADSVIDHAGTEPVEAEVASITKDAIAAEIFGSPTYVYNGHRFWGQDRLEFLEQALQRQAA